MMLSTDPDLIQVPLVQSGEYYMHRMTFLGNTATPKTNVSFDEMLHLLYNRAKALNIKYVINHKISYY